MKSRFKWEFLDWKFIILKVFFCKIIYYISTTKVTYWGFVTKSYFSLIRLTSELLCWFLMFLSIFQGENKHLKPFWDHFKTPWSMHFNPSLINPSININYNLLWKFSLFSVLLFLKNPKSSLDEGEGFKRYLPNFSSDIMETELRTLKLSDRIILDKLYNDQFFPYKNHCKNYKKVASRLRPMLFTLTKFFLKHTLSLLKENKNLLLVFFLVN